MRFLLTFLMDPSDLPDAERSDRCFREMMAFVDELKASGRLVFDSQVLPEPPSVRLALVSDHVERVELEGAFVLGGFFVIEAADQKEALALARRCPHTQVGPVELRALNETDENAYP